jgi:iron-sulfur cluster assembly protein
MVTLTDSAAEKIREMLAERIGTEENSLRIYAKPGGCSGYSYGMALDARHDDDHVFDIKGVQVVIDPMSLRLVEGSEIDYIDDLTGQGFQIHNPNAVSTCGCGSSFRTADDPGQPGSCD